MGKQKRNRRTTSTTGLLFVSREQYLERVWDVTYKEALDEGLTEEQAGKRADKALSKAKGQE